MPRLTQTIAALMPAAATRTAAMELARPALGAARRPSSSGISPEDAVIARSASGGRRCNSSGIRTIRLRSTRSARINSGGVNSHTVTKVLRAQVLISVQKP